MHEQPGSHEQPGLEDSKQSWRKWCKARYSANKSARNEEAREAEKTELVDKLEEFLKPFTRRQTALKKAGLPDRVLLYYSTFSPTSHEPGIDQLIQRLDVVPAGGSLKVLEGHFAVTRTPETGPLTIHPAPRRGPWTPAIKVEQHRFGFLQPVAGSRKLSPNCIGIALVPGLLFDKQGNRLGHGAGYYDELLARLPADCMKVGVCWSANVVDLLPTEAHDVAMTHLATEHGVKAVAESR